jgi:hypothetical protein
MSPLNSAHTDKIHVTASNSPVKDENESIVSTDKQREDNVQHSIEALPGKNDTANLSEAELERLLAEKKAARIRLKKNLVATMDRGVVAHRLHVKLPPHIHGEWVRNDQFEIDRLAELGFKIDDQYAMARSLHNDGSNNPIVGDVIFMTCPMEVKELIDEIRNEQAIANHSPRNRKHAEEKEFDSLTKRDSGGIVPTFSDGNAREARKHDIAATMGLNKLKE